MSASGIGMDPLSKYKVINTLGSGTFGAVQEVEDVTTGKHHAMKTLALHSITSYVEAEISNHKALVHPHIVQFREAFRTNSSLHIVMELANGGSLFDRLREEKKLSEKESRWYFQQLIIAVDFCHKRGVANRDIKLENLLLHAEMQLPQPILKMCDFGYSKAYHQSAAKTVVGTLSYMAPEVLDTSRGRREYDAAMTDVWSCGVVLYIMLYGVYPFDHWNVDKGCSETEKMRRMLERMQAEAYRLYPEVPVSEGCIEMLRGLLKPDPQQRFTVEQILQHPWFLRGLPKLALGMNGFYLELSKARNGESTRNVVNEQQS